ncbi:MAG: ATP-dependent DNA ligase [Betaproteobacteria bacterium]
MGLNNSQHNRASLAILVETSGQVGATRARSRKVALIANYLRGIAPDARLLAIAVGYLAGDLPQGKIGLGYAQLAQLRDRSPAPATTLTLDDADCTFTAVRNEAGGGSARRRFDLMAALLERATADEQDFLIRLIVGELRHGALEGIVLEGVASAFGVESVAVRRAAMLAGSLSPVAVALAASGAAGLEHFQLELFRPLQPMLADTAADVDDALARLGEAAFEFKLDGARVQVHKDGDRVEVYTRSLRPVTQSVPEIVERVRALPAQRLVFDGEAIALAPGGRPLPFQETMKRFGRKLEVERIRETMPLSVFFFDVLRVDDRTLIDLPLAERWQALCDVTTESDRVPRIVTAQSDEADAFATRALAAGHEGVMAKGLASTYSAGRRGREWLKIKSAHTLDLVVLAAEWGSGRRQGWLSNLHLGARDPVNGGFVMLGKTFKGMTDDTLRWQTEALLAREISRDAYTVRVRPELVVEVAFNDVQVSSQYPGGAALRFARLKGYRDDKRADEADTIEQVRALLPGP